MRWLFKTLRLSWKDVFSFSAIKGLPELFKIIQITALRPFRSLLLERMKLAWIGIWRKELIVNPRGLRIYKALMEQMKAKMRPGLLEVLRAQVSSANLTAKTFKYLFRLYSYSYSDSNNGMKIPRHLWSTVLLAEMQFFQQK